MKREKTEGGGEGGRGGCITSVWMRKVNIFVIKNKDMERNERGSYM